MSNQGEKKNAVKGDFYVYSTLSNDQNFTLWEPAKDGSPHIEVGSVFIAGKANVADKNFYTPKGILTIVSESQMELLKKSDAFNGHVKNGFISVERKKEEADIVALDMQPKDRSAQFTADDFKKAPVINESAKVV